jgi:cell division protein FtsB
MTFSAFSFQQKFVLIILSISIFLMLLFVGREFMRYQNIEKEMKKFSQKNIFLQEEITHLKDDIFYFSTENYKDKYAKESLNALNPGEEVIILTDVHQKEKIENPFMSQKTLSVPEKWKQYFFGKETLLERLSPLSSPFQFIFNK